MKSVSDLIKILGSEKHRVIGDREREFDRVAPIDSAGPKDLSFCVIKDEKALNLLKETRASVVICSDEIPYEKLTVLGKTLVAVENPRLWFIRAVGAFFPSKRDMGIHPTAIIGKNCRIADDVYIGAFVTIGDNVEIKDGSSIHSGANIGSNVRIGAHVNIKSGCVVGGDGFGYERNREGVFEKFPHLEGVIIEDNVDIGSNTCVDRGTLSDTIVGAGSKIDNLVHIAHNVIIGRNCAIIAQTMLGGGSRIGDGAWIAPAACVRDGITIGRNALVGMGAVVTKNVPEGDIVVGVPAKSVRKSK